MVEVSREGNEGGVVVSDDGGSGGGGSRGDECDNNGNNGNDDGRNETRKAGIHAASHLPEPISRDRD